MLIKYKHYTFKCKEPLKVCCVVKEHGIQYHVGCRDVCGCGSLTTRVYGYKLSWEEGDSTRRFIQQRLDSDLTYIDLDDIIKRILGERYGSLRGKNDNTISRQ